MENDNRSIEGGMPDTSLWLPQPAASRNQCTGTKGLGRTIVLAPFPALPAKANELPALSPPSGSRRCGQRPMSVEFHQSSSLPLPSFPPTSPQAHFTRLASNTWSREVKCNFVFPRPGFPDCSLSGCTCVFNSCPWYSVVYFHKIQCEVLRSIPIPMSGILNLGRLCTPRELLAVSRAILAHICASLFLSSPFCCVHLSIIFLIFQVSI